MLHMYIWFNTPIISNIMYQLRCYIVVEALEIAEKTEEGCRMHDNLIYVLNSKS